MAELLALLAVFEELVGGQRQALRKQVGRFAIRGMIDKMYGGCFMGF